MSLAFRKIILIIILLFVIGIVHLIAQDIDEDIVLLEINRTNISHIANIQNEEQINPLNSFLKSALIPGWGEISMGSNAGYVFFTLEFILWAGRLYFQEEVNLHEQEAYLYALQHANIKPADYDDDYLHKLTRYNSSGFGPGGYNEYIFKQAHNLYPEDEDLRNDYILNNAILDEELFWSWEDRDKRRIYSIKRKNADHSRDYVKFVTGTIVANHLISAINSLRISNQLNRQRVEFSIDISKSMLPTVNLKFRF